jgi:tetratricopeptide (TPR) repeat protein
LITGSKTLQASVSLAFALFLFFPQVARGADMTEVKMLEPDGGMPMWFYGVSRQFRYAIPTNFSFAYIDKAGKVAISGPFSLAKDFQSGVAIAKVYKQEMKNGKLVAMQPDLLSDTAALISPSGAITTLPRLGLGDAFYDDFAIAEFTIMEPGKPVERFFDLIDRAGKKVTDFRWKDAREYSDGLLAFRDTFGGAVPWGYCDRNNKIVIAPKYKAAERFSEGLAAVNSGGSSLFSQAYSYIDMSGKVVIEGPFSEARPFRNGLAAVMQSEKWGFVDKTGKFVVPCEYDWVGSFSGSLAPVEREKKVGYVDGRGRIVITPKFKDARDFSEGLAPATVDAKTWGFINDKGDFVIAPRFQRAFPFSDGRALVYKEVDSNQENEVVVPTLLWDAALAAREAGQFNESRAACRMLIEQDPNSECAQLAKNLLKVALPEHDVKPESIAAYVRGIRLILDGKIDEAEKNYLALTKAEPDLFAAAGSMASGFMIAKRYDDGVKLLSETLKRFPNYARGYWRLGQLYKELGNQKLAEENLAKARMLDAHDFAFLQKHQ